MRPTWMGSRRARVGLLPSQQPVRRAVGRLDCARAPGMGTLHGSAGGTGSGGGRTRLAVSDDRRQPDEPANRDPVLVSAAEDGLGLQVGISLLTANIRNDIYGRPLA